MRKTSFLAALLLVLVSSAVLAGAMPRGAFLNAPVGGVQQLTQQVNDDAIVAARYARHFRTSRNAVVEYFQDYLKPARLTKDLDCTVYTINGKTDIVSEKRVLPAGTYVFLGADGRPLLEARTGNPLADGMPIFALKSAQTGKAVSGSAGTAGESAAPASTAVSSDDVVTKVLGTPVAEIGPTPAAVIIDPAVETVASIPIGATETSVHRSSSITSILPVAALVGGLAMAGGGGGGSSARSTPDSGGTDPAEPVVPEPCTFALLAGGTGLLIARLRRR